MISSIQQEVAAEVRAEMARQRWTGRRMALRLGWNQPFISRRLSGDIPFDVNELAAIAGVLDVPVTRFFAGVGEGQLRKQPLAVAA